MPSPLDDRVGGTARVMIVSGTVCISFSSVLFKMKILAEGKKCWDHLKSLPGTSHS